MSDDAGSFISAIDPSAMRDGRHLRAVAATHRGVGDAQQVPVDAIRDARHAGDSWARIAMALGTSRQSAHRKYARLVGE